MPMLNLPPIERGRLLNVAHRKGDAPQIAAAFTAEQPYVLSAYYVIVDDLAVDTGIPPAIIFGIVFSAITTFYLALTEQIKANESGTVH